MAKVIILFLKRVILALCLGLLLIWGVAFGATIRLTPILGNNDTNLKIQILAKTTYQCQPSMS